jgi:glucose-1-phosphate thymidylyltransferase
MKAIVLAGGKGSRLFPMTKVASKQLLPVYDKPMIYYPISMLALCDFKEILVICNPESLDQYKSILGNGSRFGLKISYQTQDEPKGLPDAFVVGADFIGDSNVALLLGDNLFYGGFDAFRDAITSFLNLKSPSKGRIFAYKVQDPERYGVVSFKLENGIKKVTAIEEKPTSPKSNFAIPGFYLFSPDVVKRAKALRPSKRGETEIVELIKTYLTDGNLTVDLLGRGMAWLDTGTPESLLAAGEFVASIEKRQGLKIGCLEEIAFNKGLISKDEFESIIEDTPESDYKRYLIDVLEGQ